MTEPLAPGTVVRTRPVDPPHHTRVPRYARGVRGTVVDVQGSWPLADRVAAGERPAPTPVYTVRFRGVDLFGAGDHDVTLDVWHDVLEVVE